MQEEKWAEQKISPNYEYTDPQELQDEGKDVLVPIDLSVSDSDVISLIGSISCGLIPAGVAALWSGKDLLADITRGTTRDGP